MTPFELLDVKLQLGPEVVEVGGRVFHCLNPVRNAPGTYIALPADGLELMVISTDRAVLVAEGSNVPSHSLNTVSAQLVVQLLALRHLRRSEPLADIIATQLPQLLHARLIQPTLVALELAQLLTPDTDEKSRRLLRDLRLPPLDWAELLNLLRESFVAAATYRLLLRSRKMTSSA